jgi:hypothetical protein
VKRYLRGIDRRRNCVTASSGLRIKVLARGFLYDWKECTLPSQTKKLWHANDKTRGRKVPKPAQRRSSTSMIKANFSVLPRSWCQTAFTNAKRAGPHQQSDQTLVVQKCETLQDAAWRVEHPLSYNREACGRRPRPRATFQSPLMFDFLDMDRPAPVGRCPLLDIRSHWKAVAAAPIPSEDASNGPDCDD